MIPTTIENEIEEEEIVEDAIDMQEQLVLRIEEWRKDVFKCAFDLLKMQPAEPIDSLRGKPVRYKDMYDKEHTTILFDSDGRLVYHDLQIYTIDMFKDQTRKAYGSVFSGSRFTWQQTIELEAYNRAVNTFDKDSFDMSQRWISIKSGHGIGKTSFLSVISLHFLICFFHSQIGVTANTEDQLKDIFLKELSMWRTKIQDEVIKNQIEILDDVVRIQGAKDWFLRARVARPEKPEALAGLHGEYVLIIADEASAVADAVFEVMKGALTGQNYIVIYTSNPTRTEGEFYESQKDGAKNTRLTFTSRESPIVKEGYIDKMEEDYGKESDEVRIRVDGQFASVAEMNDKGWIPLFANVRIHFEPEQGQRIYKPIIGVDPAGKGRDSSIIEVRDSVYLKIVLAEKTSNEIDLARKIETIRDAYGSISNDIGVDAFGIGAKVVANINTKVGETVMALLCDQPREETKDRFNSYKSELAWKFREWCLRGGIIITNNQKEWLKELEKIKYKRDLKGRIVLMDKVTFKKEYGFSPDRFDAGLYTFFKDEPTMSPVISREELMKQENLEFIQRAQQGKSSPQDDNLSSM